MILAALVIKFTIAYLPCGPVTRVPPSKRCVVVNKVCPLDWRATYKPSSLPFEGVMWRMTCSSE